ncbi:MAG: TraI domain-containing protein [Gammaproteobacteria bacterium]|nr:TraI domain-containing protein [Gammaproteobacteria bacterium]
MLQRWRKPHRNQRQTVSPPPGCLAVTDAGTLLARHHDLVDELNVQVGLPHHHSDRLLHTLLLRYASFVQELPASQSHHHADAGGLLRHSLEVAVYALRAARAPMAIIPAIVEETEIKAAKERYAIATAALFHDIAKPITDQRVELVDHKGMVINDWNPWISNLAETGTTFYRVRFDAQRRYKLHASASLLVATRIIPDQGLAWLSETPELFEHWISALSGGENAITQLVKQGDSYSTARDLTGGKRPAVAGDVKTVADQVLGAIAHLHRDNKLPLNQRGAAGWITGNTAWLVSKKVLDAARDYLSNLGVRGIPTDNNRLMDELQAIGAITTTEDGRAIHTVQIALQDGWEQEMRVLAFHLDRLWPNPEERPASIAGTVTPHTQTEEVTPAVAAARDGDAQTASPSLAADPAPGPAPVKDKRDAEIPMPRLADPSPTPTVATPQNDVLEDATSEPSANKEIEDQFMTWLRDGLASGSMACNRKDALVHGLSEGLLLVSPQIFKEYAAANAIEWKHLQRRFQRKGWHKKTPDEMNVWTVEVQGERTTSTLRGFLIVDEQVTGPHPPPNPRLHIEGERSQSSLTT